MTWVSKAVETVWASLYLVYFTEYGQSSFHCTSQILRFLQVEGGRQPCFQQSVGTIFPTASACFTSLCRILAILNISHPPPAKKILIHWRLRWWLAFFNNKIFFSEGGSIVFWTWHCYALYSIVALGKKNHGTHFILILTLLQWSRTKSEVSLRSTCFLNNKVYNKCSVYSLSFKSCFFWVFFAICLPSFIFSGYFSV